MKDKNPFYLAIVGRWTRARTGFVMEPLIGEQCVRG